MPGPGPDTEECPYCKFPMGCDTVDIGIGYQQCGPYGCDNCHAVQMGPEEYHHRKDLLASGKITQEEYDTGFYRGDLDA